MVVDLSDLSLCSDSTSVLASVTTITVVHAFDGEGAMTIQPGVETFVEPGRSVQSGQDEKVWQLPVRLCHWIIVLSFVFLTLSGSMILFEKYMVVGGQNKIMLKTVHVYAGYILGAALIARIIWGFVGNPAARWRHILPMNRKYFTELRLYVAAIRSGQRRVYVGHNPLGRAMVTVLMLLLIAQVITGLIVGGADVFAWPLGDLFRNWIAATGVDPLSLVPGDRKGVDPARYAEMRAFRLPYRLTHEYIFYALGILVLLHIAGVVWTEIRERVPLVSAMITGRKQLPQPLPQPPADS